MAIVGFEWLIAAVVVYVIVYAIARIIRVIRGPRTIVKEREVIKEVVMVPCRYCGGLMPQASVLCPNCGAKKQ